MPQNIYKFIYDDYGNTAAIEVAGRGLSTQSNNYISKSSAFTEQERRDLKILGFLPPAVRTMAQQLKNNIRILNAKDSDLEKFIYVRSLFDRNVTLAHALIASDIENLMGIIYTPTVGLACQQYSSMFRKANGLHFYPGNIDQAEEILRHYGHQNIRVAVVTDNQGILGIGDQGAGGIAICLGKLMLYTQGGGIAPWHCLPISLDVGSDNQALLNDENYLGWRHPRLRGEEYIKFLQRFAMAFRAVYPNALCQWEDFSKQNAFAIRDAYLHDLISFNDDIQGTGAINLAAITTAMRIKGEALREQRFLIYGAGAGGIGIAEQLGAALLAAGLSAAEARARIFTLDSKGLITADREVEPYKRKFAREPNDLEWFNSQQDGSLVNVIKRAKISVLIGTSGQYGAFSREIVEAVMQNTARPVIMPLSNPTSKAEAVPQDIYQWSNGRALCATGSPFAPIQARDGGQIRVGQCNNVFIFPGLGQGVIASGAREVSPAFFTAAAQAVADMVSDEDRSKGILTPPVKLLKKVSYKVACAVGREA
ncbi:MAG: NAD-dependent malic enzyme, partial [Deltaproteobacteria bacterium]|nr:NAD-dependent malic enzyme [Deltaproteobacteria bacterium]